MALTATTMSVARLCGRVKLCKWQRPAGLKITFPRKLAERRVVDYRGSEGGRRLALMPNKLNIKGIVK